MIGVYGGTFNPVHFGHLRTAQEVLELFELAELKLIPCRQPAHRDEPDVPAALRLRMLEIAIDGQPGLTVDRRELDRPGPSYMVDTLQSLRAENPGNPLILFMGADAYAGLKNWHRWHALFDYAHIVVMTRPGYCDSVSDAFLQARICQDSRLLRTALAGSLYFQPVTALDISATAIRTLIAKGRSPKFLLPDAVMDFIARHHLYLSSSQDSECKQKNY